MRIVGSDISRNMEVHPHFLPGAVSNLPYQPWHYQPTFLQRVVLSMLGRLHDWACGLSFVQMEPLRTWTLLCFDPSYDLTRILKNEYERIYELANRRCIRAAVSGDATKIQQANAARETIGKRYQHYRHMERRLRATAEQSDFWRDCAKRFKISITQPRETGWSIGGLMFNTVCHNVVDTFGRTPLHTAAAWGNPEACRALLRAGADPTKPDYHGNTPLHYLCMVHRTSASSRNENTKETFGLLVNHGADPEAANIDGRTPRQIAPQAPYFQVLRQREQLERLARKQQRRRKGEAPARRAL